VGSETGEDQPWYGHDEQVQVLPYDPQWPVRFERERHLLQQAIDGFVIGGIHHVGSTAVSGLDAKPIIDILAGISDPDSAWACIDLVAPLGYLYAPYRATEMYWFCKPHPSRRTHHLHLVPVTSDRYGDELRFRDYLRSHSQARDKYAHLEHSLAEQFRQDRDAYTRAKTAFVEDILRLAGDAE
jgi:GrpB-like predicted nucleotidyltransferase (UPF0157 family)